MNREREVIPGIRKITPPPREPKGAWESPNLYLIGEDPALLVDAGYDREEDLAFVMEALGPARVQAVILTHAHIDHAGGAWKLKEKTGAQILAHPAETEAVARRFPGKTIDRALEEGDRVQAGPFTLQALHVPGHAKGHIALWLEEQAILFTGDLVTGEGSTLVAPPEGNMKDYMESLKRVLEIPARKLLPGHGPVVEQPRERILELIEHRELREVCIYLRLAEADSPLSLKELVKAMYLGLIHPGLEPAAAGTAWAHLEKMMEEGKVKAEPEGEANPFNRRFRLTPEAREEVKKLARA